MVWERLLGNQYISPFSLYTRQMCWLFVHVCSSQCKRHHQWPLDAWFYICGKKNNLSLVRWNTYHLWDANICNFSICARQRYKYTIDCWWSYVLGETRQNYCIKTNTNIQNRTTGLHKKEAKNWRDCIKVLVSWWLKSHLLCLFRLWCCTYVCVYVCMHVYCV